MHFSVLSLLSSFFMFLTAWLVLPLLVLLPLSLYFDFKFHKQRS